MIGLLIWMAGAVAMGYEITVRHFWHDALAILAVLAFVLWTLGGAAMLTRRGKVGALSSRDSKFTRADVDRMIAEAKKREQEQASRA